MIGPHDYVFGPDADIDDADLDATEVIVDGERVTEQRAEQIVADTLAEVRKRNLVPGGKSLSGGGAQSPTVQFRVPEATRKRLIERAEAEGVTPSKLARKALNRYLAG